MSLFIVFEGVDHSGKTTLIKALVNKLKQENVHVVNTMEPGGTELGDGLRKLLLHSKNPIVPTAEFLMFLADRYQHFTTIIQPALQNIDIVICDRSFYSTFVYQGLDKKVAWDLILQFHQSLGLLQRLPDLVFFLKSRPDLLQKRSQKSNQVKNLAFDRFHYHQNENKLAQMQDFYQETFQKLTSYVPQLEVIDVNQSLANALEVVFQIVFQKWKEQKKL